MFSPKLVSEIFLLYIKKRQREEMTMTAENEGKIVCMLDMHKYFTIVFMKDKSIFF